MKAYTPKQKKQIFEKINSLSSTEHEEIYNIIQKRGNIPFTTNKNGVFFNLTALDDDLIHEIERFVGFCLTNNKGLDEYDRKLNECKTTQKNIISVSLDNIVDMRTNNTALPINNSLSLVSNNEPVIDNKNAAKIVNFIERLYADKTQKKKMNMKFHNAKKKYAKRVVSESKFEYEFMGDLVPDTYLLANQELVST